MLFPLTFQYGEAMTLMSLSMYAVTQPLPCDIWRKRNYNNFQIKI